MKEKIKEYLLAVTLIYGIVIVLLMIMTYTNMEEYLEFEKDNNFYEELNNYKNEVSKIENQSCKQEINNLINYIEKHNLSGKVNLKEYYNNTFHDNNYLPGYHWKINEACSIKKRVADSEGLSMMYLTASIQNDEILQPYMYQYEIHLKDNTFRQMAEPSFLKYQQSIQNDRELNILKTTLKIVNDKGDVSED